MLHGLYKRDEPDFIGIAAKKFVESRLTREKPRVNLVKQASIRFLDIELDDTGDVPTVYPVTPIGKVKEEQDFDGSINLGWTLAKPRGMSLSDVLLNPGVFVETEEGRDILQPGTMRTGTQFVIDDFGLNSPHSFRRLF